MHRNLASIQRIYNIRNIPNADKIQVATILGWNVVIEKNKYKENELVVYCEIDSIMPDKPEFEFLRPRGFKIKTMKLRGCLSQGICFPLSILSKGIEITEGMDVTEILHITKHEVILNCREVKGNFPYFIPKTDEIRIQSVPEIIKEIYNKISYITTKLDGTSATYYLKDNIFGVCSRNLELKQANNPYWHVVEKYNIENKLRDYGKNIAIQGEIIGQGIQGNKLELKNIQFKGFNVYNIDTQKYFNYIQLINFLDLVKLPIVSVEKTLIFKYMSIEELLEVAKGNYDNNTPREGIVIRPIEECYSELLKGRLSFKVVNNDFLLKYGE